MHGQIIYVILRMLILRMSGAVLGGFLGFPEIPFGLDFTQTTELASC